MERYFNATPQEVNDWKAKRADQALDPIARQILRDVNVDADNGA